MTDVDFKDEEQVKQYVQRIAVEYRFGCEKEKRADSCHLFAEYVESIERDSARALDIFRDNCNLRRFAPSCFKYGRALLRQKNPTDRDATVKEAEQALRTACDGDPRLGPQTAYSCRLLGLLYAKQRKSSDALKCMEKACADERDPDACWHLSSWYYGRGAVARASTNSNKIATSQDAKLVSEPSANPETVADETPAEIVEPDIEKCVHYAQLACERGAPQPCANLVFLYRKGACDRRGRCIKPDKALADKYKQMADDIVENVRDNVELNLSGGV